MTDMKCYSVMRKCVCLPDLSGREFYPDDEKFCSVHPFVRIESYPWGKDYTPEARAWMVWDDDALNVLLAANEETISVSAHEFNGEVYKDSCLECFLRPIQDDPRYLNFEANAEGTMLIGFGSDRETRHELSEMPAGMDVRASKHCGAWWAVAYRIPFALTDALYGRRPVPGDIMMGNFYKCDESIHPHFGSWNPIANPTPDFHRPEAFGMLKMEPVSNS